MKLPAMISHFKDSELVQAISSAFQKVKERLSPTSETIEEPYRSKIENFVLADWQGDHTAVMLCIKCEQPFNVDPCGEENLVWCQKKKVLVPQCPHCGTNDVET